MSKETVRLLLLNSNAIKWEGGNNGKIINIKRKIRRNKKA